MTIYICVVWDSNGRFPSGIMAGSFFEPGNFDQCMEIRESEYGHGKYCILELRVPQPIRMVNFTGISKYHELVDGINWVTGWNNFSGIANGLCFPSVCSDAEIGQIVPAGEWVERKKGLVQNNSKKCL